MTALTMISTLTSCSTIHLSCQQGVSATRADYLYHEYGRCSNSSGFTEERAVGAAAAPIAAALIAAMPQLSAAQRCSRSTLQRSSCCRRLRRCVGELLCTRHTCPSQKFRWTAVRE
jgi:hypothetical protein